MNKRPEPRADRTDKSQPTLSADYPSVLFGLLLRSTVVLCLSLCCCFRLAHAGDRQVQPVRSGEPAPSIVRPDHECHIFGYLFGTGSGSPSVLSTLCQYLFDETLPGLRSGGQDPVWPGDQTNGGRTLVRSASRDGWGFGYFLAPPHPGIERPILIKGGPPASSDLTRWNAAIEEMTDFGLGEASSVLGHVRKSSSGPDRGALPNPHPFADSLMGRWWLFSHNGHMSADTLRNWISPEFLLRHPLDYDVLPVDSELLFRYCEYEIERHGDVQAGLLFALHRVKGNIAFVFNICLTDGDTLWTAHSLSNAPFYYQSVANSSAWWASTAVGSISPLTMRMHALYWFVSGSMGWVSYE